MSQIKLNSIIHPTGTANNITLDSSGNVTLGGDLIMTSNSLASPASAGLMEYDGKSLYFTTQGTQRGVVPGMQLFRLGTNLTGLNATGNQNVFGVSVTLSSNTTYAFETYYTLIKSAGTTSHNVSLGFNGTCTIGYYNFSHYVMNTADGTPVNNPVYTNRYSGSSYSLPTSANVVSGSTTSVRLITVFKKGMFNITNGGTLTPIYSLSAAPGGAYDTESASYMLIYPVATANGAANTVIGTWA